MVVVKHRHTRKAEVLSVDGNSIISRTPILILAKTGASATTVNIKTAGSFHGQIMRDAEGNVDLVAEMRKHPDALWIRVKAIEADVPNDNGDFFSWDELLKSYKTFEGAPVFTNHENSKVEAAKGKVVKAELDEKEKAVYCTMFIDRQANGPLARAIEEGYVTDVSMGTQVDYSTCSVCNNKAYTAETYCFVPGTPVLMSDLSVRPIENIIIGDEVIDGYGKTTKVTKTFQHDVSEKMQCFSSRAILGALVATSNHPFLAQRRGEYRFVNAVDIADDETLFTPRVQTETSDALFAELPFEQTKENKALFARLIGYYTAEGCVADQNGKPYTTEFCIHSSEQHVASDIRNAAHLFDLQTDEYSRERYGSKALSIRIYSNWLASFLKQHVSGTAASKRLSKEIVRLPDNLVQEFLNAYIEGDGHCNKHNNVIIHSASQTLAFQVYNLLLRLGCSASLNSYEQPGGPTGRDKRFWTYRISLGTTQAQKIVGSSQKLIRAASKVCKQSKLDNVITDDGLFAKHTVYTIEEIPYDGPVYNIETESHSYVANNTSVHNCDHVKTMKGRMINGTKVFERNYGLKFIEISVVTDGACKDCTIREVLDPDEYMLRVADAVHCVREYRTAASIKNAGPQEVQKLNQAMDLLEDVARAILDQRQYVDMEFLNKVSGVLSDLQHVNDELVDQGYGRMPGPGQEGQGQAGAAPQMGIPPLPDQGAKGNAAEAPKPFVAGPASAGVGSVTEPAMAASDVRIISARIEEVAKKMSNICQEMRLSQGAAMDKEKANQTVSKLAKIWENPSVRNYRTEVTEGDFTVVVGDPDIFGLKGGKRIASLKIANLDEDVREKLRTEPKECAEHLLSALQNKYAATAKSSAKDGETMEKEAAYTPSNTKEQQEETMEAQLRNQKVPLHPRTDEVRESITEDQLKKKTEGYDEHARQEKARDAITEKQLREGDYKGYEYHKRQDEPRDEITELQIRNEKWKGNVTPAGKDPSNWTAGSTDQSQQITEGQLEDWKKAEKRHLPTDRITEKQLVEDAENWGRRIASKEDAVKAKTAALKAAAKTSVATGATPDEILAVIADFTGSAKNHVAAEKAVESLSGLKDRRQAMLVRAKFHGASKMASQAEVADYLLGASADEGMSGSVALATLSTLADQKNALAQISDAISAAKTEEKAPKTASSRDFLKEAFAEGVEDVTVELNKSAIKADEKDTEKFAAAAFEAAIKVAEKSGLQVKDKVHVTSHPDGKVEVSMTAVAAKKEVKEEPKVDLVARKEARKVMAQMGGEMPAPGGGGAGGAMPGPGGGTTMPPPPPGGAMPGPETPPVAALGAPPGGPEGEEDETKEALPPGSICPVCGSENVDIKHGDFTCNDCGGAGEIQVSINIKEWPGVIEDTEPKGGEAAGEEVGGIGDMGGGPGMEMPPVGMAAAFKVTPEMVKIAGNKPIGTFCPHCGSSKTKLAMKQGSGIGRCQKCKGAYRIETLVDPDAGSIMARIAWYDLKAKKFAGEYLKAVRLGASVKVERKAQKVSLMRTLRDEGLSAKFANADLTGKAAIIAELVDKGLLRKPE